MNYTANKCLAISLLLLTVGCSSTPSPMSHVYHFSSAAEDAEHRKCMSDNALFNNRQLMVAPTAVESAWTYCVRQSDVWYPGKGEEKTQPTRWTEE